MDGEQVGITKEEATQVDKDHKIKETTWRNNIGNSEKHNQN